MCTYTSCTSMKPALGYQPPSVLSQLKRVTSPKVTSLSFGRLHPMTSQQSPHTLALFGDNLEELFSFSFMGSARNLVETVSQPSCPPRPNSSFPPFPPQMAIPRGSPTQTSCPRSPSHSLLCGKSNLLYRFSSVKKDINRKIREIVYFINHTKLQP